MKKYMTVWNYDKAEWADFLMLGSANDCLE